MLDSKINNKQDLGNRFFIILFRVFPKYLVPQKFVQNMYFLNNMLSYSHTRSAHIPHTLFVSFAFIYLRKTCGSTAR